MNVVPAEDAGEIARLRAAMLQQNFFLMHRDVVSPDTVAALTLAHLRWVCEAEKNGQLLFSGPLFDGQDRQLMGLSLLRAPDWNAAEAIARADPYVSGGAVAFRMQRWMLCGGRVSLTLDFSDQTVHIV